MLEIKAKFNRSPVYFANELITCLITITNRSNSETDVEQLAWSSAQLHCHLSVDENKVRFNPNKLNSKWIDSKSSATSSTLTTGRDTSFNPCKGERGHLIFSTEPRILFCDLRLRPNQSESFTFAESIPNGAPPSYTGNALKYVYKLTIGTQRLNSIVQFLKLPLKIVLGPIDSANLLISNTKPTLSDVNQSSETNLNLTNGFLNDANEEVFDDNPMDSSQNTCHSRGELSREHVLDVMLQKIDCLSAKRSPNTFVITNLNGKVAKFWILKSTFKLGEDVVGLFDFSEAEVPCVQFSVTLQSEETIHDEFKVRAKSSPFVQSYSKRDEFCLHTSSCQAILPIPLTITPTFETNLVSLSWKLHFEFVTTKPEEVENIQMPDSQGVQFQCPKSVNVQTMVWDLPITILPTHPIQIGRGLQLPASSFIVI